MLYMSEGSWWVKKDKKPWLRGLRGGDSARWSPEVAEICACMEMYDSPPPQQRLRCREHAILHLLAIMQVAGPLSPFELVIAAGFK